MSDTSSKNKSVVQVLFIIFIIIVAIFIFKDLKGKKDETPDLTTTTNSTTTPSPSPVSNENKNTMPPQEAQQLQIVTTKEGSGPAVQSGNVIEMNYTGKLTNGIVFDSNIDPKFQHVTPFKFTLGAGEVIKGWDQGIVGMKVGEKRTLTIPASLAYGDRGIPGAIPPNATLIFDVELTKIVK